VARYANGGVVTSASTVWSSREPSIVVVVAAGLVRAISNGTARIDASVDGLAASMTVTVQQVAASIHLSSDSILFAMAGDTAFVSAEVRDRSGAAITTPALQWTSDNTSVATVNSAGVITALHQGSATITASAGDDAGRNVKATLRVTVPARITSLTVSPSQVRLDALGDTTRIGVIARDADGNVMSAAAITWTSSSPSVVTADASGVLRAVANGAATVTAAVEGLTASVDVTVQQAAAAIRVQPDSVVADSVGRAMVFTARVTDRRGNVVSAVPLSWSSSSSAVAISLGEGRFRALANGTAIVSATAVGGASGTGVVSGTGRAIVRIRIIPRAPVQVAVTPAAATLQVGQTSRLNATITNDTTGVSAGAAWSSSAPTIATVDSAGNVTALAAGVTTITATSRFDANAHASAVITVIPATVVTVTPSSASMTIGYTLALGGSLAGAADVLTAGLTYSSSNAAVATVNPLTGSVIAVTAGTATITVRSVADPTHTATSTITVVPPAAVITSVTTDKGVPVIPTAVKGPIIVTALITAVVSPIKAVEVGIDSNVECTTSYSPTVNPGQGAATVTCKIRTEAKSNGQMTYPNGPHTIFVRAIDTNGVAATTRLSITTSN
jgi:uncharacterized protein YjdB